MPRRAVPRLLPTDNAGFTTSFEELTEGADLEVAWEGVLGEEEEEGSQVYLSGRVFNATDGGVTAFQANISTTLSSPPFTWSNIPYPLPYIPTAQYELELLPLRPTNPSRTVRTPLFSIASSAFGNLPPAGDERTRTSIVPEHEQGQSRGSGASTNAIIAAVSTSLGIPVLIAAGACVWWVRRHMRRVRYEESRRMRYQTIID